MRRMILAGIAILAAVALADTGLSHAADAPVLLKGVKVTERADGLSVVIDTSGPVKYQSALIDGPDRIVIDMMASYAAPRSRWTATPEPIKEIRGSQWKAETARVVVELTRHVEYRIEERANGLALTVERGASVATPKLDPPKLPAVTTTTPRPEPPTNPPAFIAPKPPVQKAEVAKPEAVRIDSPRKAAAVVVPVGSDSDAAKHADVAARPATHEAAKSVAAADAPKAPAVVPAQTPARRTGARCPGQPLDPSATAPCPQRLEAHHAGLQGRRRRQRASVARR